VPPNFNTEIINHVMAKGLQRLYCNKGSLRWHLKSFWDVCASYLQGIFTQYIKKGFIPAIITASWKAITADGPTLVFLLFYGKGLPF